MKKSRLYLNIMFLLAFISLHLPIWFNGKFASFLAILHTIISDNLSLESINTIAVIGFLLPLYVIYYLIFSKIDSNFIRITFCIVLILALLPFGAMFPPKC